ncbi:MAG TPA: zinc ribbon domain-containing protein, partial [Planctomycetes bacterium]|nr:zinc ribbon domain-containing protein [Planctomycetota bacterium]
MHCPKCGTLQPDTDKVCDVCGAELSGGATATAKHGHSSSAPAPKRTPTYSGPLSSLFLDDAPAEEEAEEPSDAAPSMEQPEPEVPESGDEAVAPAVAPRSEAASLERGAPAADDSQQAPHTALVTICDSCQQPTSRRELKFFLGKYLCPVCLEAERKKTAKPVQAPQEQPPAVEETAAAHPAPGRLPGRLAAYVRWPDFKLAEEEESYRDAWKKSKQNLSTPPPIKE